MDSWRKEFIFFVFGIQPKTGPQLNFCDTVVWSILRKFAGSRSEDLLIFTLQPISGRMARTSTTETVDSDSIPGLG